MLGHGETTLNCDENNFDSEVKIIAVRSCRTLKKEKSLTHHVTETLAQIGIQQLLIQLQIVREQVKQRSTSSPGGIQSSGPAQQQGGKIVPNMIWHLPQGHTKTTKIRRVIETWGRKVRLRDTDVQVNEQFQNLALTAVNSAPSTVNNSLCRAWTNQHARKSPEKVTQYK